MILGTSKLFRAVASPSSPNSSSTWLKEASAFNVNYSDSGLFGVFGIASAGHAPQLVNGIAKGIKSIISSIDSASLEAAKNRFKVDLYSNTESRSGLMEFVAHQALISGKVDSVESFVSEVGKVTVEDLKRVASKTFSSKPSLVVVGDIENVPTLDSIHKVLSS